MARRSGKRTIDFTLLIDSKKGTASIRKLKKGVKDFSTSTSQDAKTVSKSWDKTSKSIKSVGKATSDAARSSSSATNKMSSNMKGYTSSVDNANKALKRLNTTGAKASTTLNKMRADVSVTGGAGGGGVGLGDLGLLGAGAIGAQAMTKTIKTAAGDRQELTKIIDYNKEALTRWNKAGVLQGKVITEINRQHQARTVDTRDYRKTQEKVISDTKKYNKELLRQKGLIENSRVSWMKYGAAAVIAGVAIKKAWDLANVGAMAKQQEQAFRNLSESVGADSNKIIEDLKRLSGNTVDTATLIRSAGTAMLMGLAPEKLGGLMEIARATARMTGQTVVQAFGDITLAVARSSKMILDNLGIIVSLEEANKNYARQIGKNAKDLTDAERKLAFLNETLIKGGELVRRIGVEGKTSSEKFQELTAEWENFKVALGATLEDPFEALAGSAATFLKTLTKITEWFDKRENDWQKEMLDAANELKHLQPLEFFKMPEYEVETQYKKMTKLLAKGVPTRLDFALDDPAKYYEEVKPYVQTDEMKKRYIKYYADLKALAENAEHEEDARELERLKESRPLINARLALAKEFTSYIQDRNQVILNSTKNMYAAEVIALENRYNKEKEKWGETLAGYAAYQLEKQAIDQKYADERVAIQNNMLGQFAYGVKRSVEEVETWGETWIRVGMEVNDQLATSITSNLWSIVEGTKSAKQAAIDYGISTVKWLFDILVKRALLSLLIKLHGTESTQASTMAVSGLQAEMTGVLSLTSAYYALAVAKAAAGVVGGAAGGAAGAAGGAGGAVAGKASGGSVSMGQPYIVGEKGPEIFTPKSSGSITSNDDAFGDSEVNLSVVNLVDPAMIEQYLASRAGKDAIINIISSNKRTVRRTLS